MRAGVTLRLGDTREVCVPAGGLIGRLQEASLRLDDPRISEAHALVSLRGRKLVLMSLRGTLRVGRRPLETVVLSVGQRIELATDLEVEVVRVELPVGALALVGLGASPVELESEVATLYQDPWRLEPGYDRAGRAHVAATGGGWSAHVDGRVVPLLPGVRFDVDGRAFRVVEVEPGDVQATLRQLDQQVPLRLTARYDTVQIVREGRETVMIAGVSAKILTELVRYASPVPWEWIARDLFGPIQRSSARMRWDRNLKTLRSKLREAGVRGDLAFCDGHGNVELILGPGDVVVDES